MKSFLYMGEEIKYEVKRSKRKTIGIKISKATEIVVMIPYNCSEKMVAKVVEEKKTWIFKHWKSLKEAKANELERQYKEGEEINYLGNNYPIKIKEHDKDLIYMSLEQGNFNIFINHIKSTHLKDKIIRNAVLKWYEYQAYSIFKDITDKYSAIMGVTYGDIKLKIMKSIWGSCSYRNNLSYNLRLVMAPKEVIEYVILHELCHILEKNHSSRFWSLVERYMPDYKLKKRWLKENGYKLNFDYIYQ